MNANRRKTIDEIISKLSEIKDKLSETKLEEEDSYDSIPENLLGTFRAEQSEEAIAVMDESIDSLDNIMNDLGELLC